MTSQSFHKKNKAYIGFVLIGLAGVASLFIDVDSYHLLFVLSIGIAVSGLFLLDYERVLTFFPLIAFFTYYQIAGLGIAPESIFLAIGFGFWLVSSLSNRQQNQKKFPKYIVIAFIAWIAINILGVILAPVLNTAMISIRAWFINGLLVYLIYKTVNNRDILNGHLRSLQILVVVIFFLMFYTILRTQSWEYFRLYIKTADFPKIFSYSVFANPNVASFYGAVLFPIMLVQAIIEPGYWRKAKYILLSLLSIGIVFMTFSRAGLLELVIASLFLLWSLKKISPSLMIVVVIILLGLNFVITTQGFLSSSIERLFEGRDTSFNIRMGLIEVARDSLRENPLMGSGPASFQIQMLRYVPIIAFLPANISIAPHNDWIRILVENGLIGFSIFLIFALTLVFYIIRKYKQNVNLQNSLYLGLLCGLIVALADSFAHEIFAYNLFWYLLGIVLAFPTILLTQEE